MDIDSKINYKGITSALDSVNLPRHRWYYYKEGFSPLFVDYAIDFYGLKERKVVVDPFNGSGTTTLTAASRNLKSIGLEINPFTSFIAETKNINENVDKFCDVLQRTADECKKGHFSKLEEYSTFTRSESNNKKWLFNIEVIRAFNGGFRFIQNIKKESCSLIKLALISAAMENCNAVKDGKCLRYKTNWQDRYYNADTFINSLIKKGEIIKSDLINKIKIKPIILNVDSRNLNTKSFPNSFDLCITSPPYLNTFDYSDIYRPELFLGEFIGTNDELNILRLETIRSHIQVNWNKPDQQNIKSYILKDFYSRIEKKQNLLMHKNIPAMILAYFEDMSIVFKKLLVTAKKNAHVWMIVSTSAYANEHIPVDLILAEIATNSGWKLNEVGVIREINKRMTKYSPDISKLRESVIILEK